MTSMEEREKAFEKKFVHDQEMRFKLQARRNRLLGMWVAELMGLEGPQAEAYALELVAADLKQPGEDDLIEKINADLAKGDTSISTGEIRARMGEFMAQVLQEAEAATPHTE